MARKISAGSLSAAAPLLLALAACGDRPALGAGAQEMDSAGVRVLVNSAAELQRVPLLRPSAEPVVRVGVVDGAPEYQLFRVGTAVTLSDGTLVVGNSGTQELRYYDARGNHVATAGGQGEGPGEFMTLSVRGTLPGDSVIAWDARLRRFSIWSASGAFARSFSVPAELGMALTMATVAGTRSSDSSSVPAPDRERHPSCGHGCLIDTLP